MIAFIFLLNNNKKKSSHSSGADIDQNDHIARIRGEVLLLEFEKSAEITI